ncbi:MAG: D-alanine--D-alanine ligase [Acidimicrobiia bacterium]|nr:D-alanine--D-alanine ligase [Acidimicrobiia bacterium]
MVSSRGVRWRYGAVVDAADHRPPRNEKIRLVVLLGGQSAEHDISRLTARHVLAAVDPDRYLCEPVGIDRDGVWHRAPDAHELLAEVRQLDAGEGLPLSGSPSNAVEVLGAGHSTATTDSTDAPTTTVVLPLLHGPMGEDGTVQGLLELADLPYVGSGVLGSALAMDKGAAKDVLAANGLPQARWRTLHAEDVTPAVIEELHAELGPTVFVKPANMGSSIGVSRATTVAELADAVALAATYDLWMVVEEAVVGREIECGVLGPVHAPVTSLPGEVVPASDFYDYEDKYHDDAAALHVPANLDDDVVAELQDLARQSFRALRCDGMARVDFFLEAPGRGLLVNEVNTIPGFTPISMYPRMWEASGVSYTELIDRLVGEAIDRHRRRPRRTDVAGRT